MRAQMLFTVTATAALSLAVAAAAQTKYPSVLEGHAILPAMTLVPAPALLAESPSAGYGRGDLCVCEAPARRHRRQDSHSLSPQRQLPRRVEPDAG